MDNINFLKELTHANPHYVDIISLSIFIVLIKQKDKDEFISLLFEKLSLLWLFEKKFFRGFFYFFSVSLLSLWSLTIILFFTALLFSGKILFKISFDFEFLVSTLTLFNNLSLSIILYSILYFKINHHNLGKILTNFVNPKNDNKLSKLGVAFILGGTMGAFASRYGDSPTFIFFIGFLLFFCIKFILDNPIKNKAKKKTYRKDNKS